MISRTVIFIGLLLQVCAMQGCMYTSTSSGKTLVWQDEFEYSGVPDKAKWVFQNGDGCPDVCGWGNNELQYYTEGNARVEDGRLIIEARKDEGGHDFTSSKLLTRTKGAWETGYIEVRAKLPQGRGTWPAIWMLPDVEGGLNWPLDGEIDIMEHVGYNQGMVYGTIHTEKYNHVKGTHKSDSIFVGDVADEFHTYALSWTTDELAWFIDDKEFYRIERDGEGKEGWPFDQEFYLILNVAVGGDWGGKYGVDDSIFPQRMEVDYVRVYSE